MSKAKVLLFAFLFIFVSFSAQAKIIHVPSDSSTIQKGINGAVNGDTVLVASGTYYELINYNGKEILVASHYITTKDTTFISSTIINGDSNGTVVTFATGEDSTSKIVGFTIMNGYDDTPYPYYQGGGIFCSGTSPVISHNKIIYNVATIGGGIFCNSASPTISDNEISNNRTIGPYGWGAGIGTKRFSYPRIEGNVIRQNHSLDRGGGIFIWANYLTIDATIIRRNLIIDNSAGGGGGISCTNAHPLIENNTFYGNLNNTIHTIYDSPTIIRNNLIANTVTGFGVYCADQDSFPTITHCDFSNNTKGSFYGCPAGFGDTTSGFENHGITCDSFYNIFRNPLFVSQESLNFGLRCNSPCIDAGDSASPYDLDGTVSDIGAFFFDQNSYDGALITSPESSFTIPCHLYTYFVTLADTTESSVVIEYSDYPSWLTVTGDSLHGMPIIGISDTAFMVTSSLLYADDTCLADLKQVSIEVLLCGDANHDEGVTITDIVYLINYLFMSASEPVPDLLVTDVMCDGGVDIVDLVYLVNYLFKGGPPPCEP